MSADAPDSVDHRVFLVLAEHKEIPAGHICTCGHSLRDESHAWHVVQLLRAAGLLRDED